MVARIPSPLGDDINYLGTVLNEREDGRNHAFFLANAEWWKQRVNEYNLNNGDPTRIAASTVLDVDKAKYQNLYSGGPDDHLHRKEIDRLREQNRKIMFCPACGEDGTPRTLDHYLPKTTFPEYSIHLKNLVPMCDICQEKKGTKYVTANQQKHYFHSYFDAIPDALFIVDIRSPFCTPTFSVRAVAQDPDNLALADNHAKGLELYERLAGFCVEKYVHLLKLQSENRRMTNTDVRTLLRAFLLMEELKTSNGWAATFYRSVLGNDALLQYLSHDDLPNHL